MIRTRLTEGDLDEAWSEAARLRQRAVEAWHEADQRRRLVGALGGDPFHPRTQGLAAAAEFHQDLAAKLEERARGAARLAAELEVGRQAARGAARCA